MQAQGQAKARRAAPIGDEAVRARTGKTWSEWFALLDSAGAMRMDHKDIVAYLRERHGVAPWWQQMVVVAYERARGLREVHQTSRGYQMSSARTFAVPLARLYQAWADQAQRGRWLPGTSLRIRRLTPARSLRAAWADGEGSVEVNFYAKGEGKSQVTVQHARLADSRQVAEMKACWAAALDRLKEFLEG